MYSFEVFVCKAFEEHSSKSLHQVTIAAESSKKLKCQITTDDRYKKLGLSSWEEIKRWVFYSIVKCLSY